MEALLLLLVWTVPSGAEEWLCKGLDNPIDLNYHMIQLTGCRDHKPDLETPLVAMTPEVFLRFAASHRYFNKERDCQTGMFQTSGHEFKSRNWRFCVAGKCDPSLKECRCYDHFAGPRCDQFVGNCWMIYCYLHKCEVGFDSLNCECNRDLFHKPTLSGKYFYPDGPSDTFLPPPPSFREVIEPFSLPVISDYYLAPGSDKCSSELLLEVDTTAKKFPKFKTIKKSHSKHLSNKPRHESGKELSLEKLFQTLRLTEDVDKYLLKELRWKHKKLKGQLSNYERRRRLKASRKLGKHKHQSKHKSAKKKKGPGHLKKPMLLGHLNSRSNSSGADEDSFEDIYDKITTTEEPVDFEKLYIESLTAEIISTTSTTTTTTTTTKPSVKSTKTTSSKRSTTSRLSTRRTTETKDSKDFLKEEFNKMTTSTAMESMKTYFKILISISKTSPSEPDTTATTTLTTTGFECFNFDSEIISYNQTSCGKKYLHRPTTPTAFANRKRKQYEKMYKSLKSILPEALSLGLRSTPEPESSMKNRMEFLKYLLTLL